jgi:hypothetical protein
MNRPFLSWPHRQLLQVQPRFDPSYIIQSIPPSYSIFTFSNRPFIFLTSTDRISRNLYQFYIKRSLSGANIMADVSLLDYGESAFDLVDDEFLTLIGASEYNVPIDMNDYSYTLFDSDQLPWADIDPALFANPSCPITSSDINESTGLNIDQGSAGQINSPELTRLSGLAESNSNSPLCVVDFSASGANQTRKGLEACLFEFEGTKLKNTSKKGRKPFSKERRREVGQVRKAGACSRCRITKTPVSIP